MMKIGIVTVHRCFNYGACLQAYATVMSLNKMGYDAEIIDYVNEHEQRFLRVLYSEDGSFWGYIKSFARTILLGQLKYYKKGLGKIRDMYPMTKNEYRDIEELNDLSYDVLVSGSDQIWNPNITGGLDKVFLLKFGKAQKRLSIASSMGNAKLNEQECKDMKEALSEFSAISVREEFAKEQLANLTDKHISVIMDPTLLFTKEEWVHFCRESKYYPNKEDFILVYFVSPDKHKNDYKRRVAEYAMKFGLPVWTIQFGNYKWGISSKRILGASMEDFVALFLKARFIITDSFHGVVFATTFNKSFVAFSNRSNSGRVENYLKMIGLEKQLDLKPQECQPIDYQLINDRIKLYRERSVEWIKKAVEG